MNVRVAGVDDVDLVVQTLTSAFFHDPLWGPAFPDEARRAEQAAVLWRMFAAGGVPHGWVLVTDRVESASIWIPPGENEMSDEQVEQLPGVLAETVGERAAEAILGLFHEFETIRPTEPHFYLSLLGTHDLHRGQGLGMELLREGLRRVDTLGMPAYLESSNPANNRRYESVGFAPLGGFVTPSGHAVTTMWRPAA